MIKLTAEEREMERDDAENAKLNDTTKWRKRHDERIDAVEKAVLENTRITAEIKNNTDDVVEFVRALKVVHTIAKGFTAIAAAIAVVFVMWKSGGKP